ncbi:glycosyltransferase family 2 protein [Candidatus Pelagibacter sp.]|uniref:glycosyltransferase family 2 protein n=1 Tax=Candidatus Pelagibacter sp. TaxID=2024849 RepID=UPI003F84B70E
MDTDKLIIIPSYNEIRSLKKICKHFKKNKFNFLVLDDHSSDGSHEWLKKNRVSFIRNKTNIGYERNILKGFRYALKNKKINYVITFDGDGEHKKDDILKIYKILKKSQIDLLVCNRKNLNRWSEYILSFLFNLRFDLKDPISGFKAYKIVIIKKFINFVKSNNFLIDIVFYSLINNFKVKNYGINTYKNKNSKIGNNIYTNLKILKCLKFLISNY